MTEDVPLTSNLITNNPAVPDPEVKATKPRRRFREEIEQIAQHYAARLIANRSECKENDHAQLALNTLV